MEFRILGPVQASTGGQPLQFGGARQRALLAYLLLHANEVVSADRLLEELWIEPPGGGVAVVQTQVSRLRKVLRDRIATSGRGYELRVEPGECDLERFRGLLAEAGATADPHERSRLLREADGLWRGEPLAGLDVPFAAAEAAALEELRLAALEDRLEADLQSGLDGELVSELSALIARYPLRERLRGQLILGLYRADRQAEALEAYRQTRQMLDEELGLEPSPALRELERAILRQDPALTPLAAATAESAPPDRAPYRRVRPLALVAVAFLAVGAAGAATAVVLTDADGAKRALHPVKSHVTVATPPSHLRRASTHRARAHSRPNAKRGRLVKHRTAPLASTPVVSTVTTPAQPATSRATAPITSTATPTHTKTHAKTKTTTPRETATPPAKPVTISDAFESDYVDPTIWHEIRNGGDVSIGEQGGQLQLTVGADAVPGGTYNNIDVHVGTQCSFPGNFDARVDYQLLEWPLNDNVLVGLNAIYVNAAVMRESSSQWGDEYSSWVIPSNGGVPLPDASGSLRVTRVGGVETTYFWHKGSWRRLAAAPAAGAAVFGLQAMSDLKYSFGKQEIKVAFDNFTVTGVNPNCPPGSQPPSP